MKKLKIKKKPFQNCLEYIKKLMKSRSGFTLIEIVAVMAVVSVLMAPLFGIFNAGHSAFYREDENVKATRCARIAMERVVEAVRQADVVESTNDEGNTVYNYDIKYVEGGSIKVKNDASSGKYTLIDAEYAFDGIDGADEFETKKLIMKIYLDDGLELTGELPEGRKIVRVKITVRIDEKRTKDYQVSTEVYLRNN